MQNNNQRSWVVLFFLSAFFFWCAADRFYMGKTGSAFLKMITMGGFGFWTIYDWYLVLTNQMTDEHGRVASR